MPDPLGSENVVPGSPAIRVIVVPNGAGTIGPRYNGFGTAGMEKTRLASVISVEEPATTATLAVPVLPSLTAVMTADPAPTAAANPFDETVATLGALLDQEMLRPERLFPA